MRKLYSKLYLTALCLVWVGGCLWDMVYHNGRVDYGWLTAILVTILGVIPFIWLEA